MRNWKQLQLFVLLLVLLNFFACQDVNQPTNSYTVTVSGQVVNKVNSPLDSVVITISNPFMRDTTHSDGTFNFSFTSSEKNDVPVTIRFSRANFFDTTFSANYSADKKTLALGTIQMRGVSAAADSVIAGKPSARAGALVFLQSQYTSISIRKSGGIDATNLLFEARDSSGTPVDANNAVWLHFKFIWRPDSITELSSDSVKTNSKGQAVVQLTAGQKAGLVQIQSSFISRNSAKIDTVRSSIVVIPVYGGLPDSTHFSITSQKYNIPGAVKFNLRNSISALIGDKFGNPVQPGTPVYFSTSGGIIQPVAQTSNDGTVSVDLISGLPVPVNGGFVQVKADVGTSSVGFGKISGTGNKDVDFNTGPIGKRLKKEKAALLSTKTTTPKFSPQSLLSRTIPVLFSGPSRIYTADSVFIVPAQNERRIDFTVSDPNGFPLSEGTTITVSGIGLDTTGAVLSGDLNKTIPDTYDRAYTNYSFVVADKRIKDFNTTRSFTVTIEVNSANGNVKKIFSGVLASGVSDSGKVGSISVVNASTDSLVVNGGGSPTSKDMQVKVLDALGNPAPNIPVNFEITRSVNGGEYLSSSLVVTNSSGIAATTLNSGIRSGLVQVTASVKREAAVLSADPKNFYIRTGTIAKLGIVGVSSSTLSVRGGGGTENSVIVVEGRDSLGNAIDHSNQAMISFALFGDTAGTRISPVTTKTDPATGRVTTLFSSGTKSGIVQIIASALNGKVTSAPVQLITYGGFPVDSLLVISGIGKNISLNEPAFAINVQAGDAYGNPVKPGTPVYFTTNAGVITASAVTDASGRASTQLSVVNNPSLLGVRSVTVRTIAENGSTISRTINFLLTGQPVLTLKNVVSDTITVYDGSSVPVNFSITDISGNPIAKNHDVKVAAGGSLANELTFSGDASVKTPDTDDKVNGVNYNFTVSDNLPGSGHSGIIPVTITVSGVSGTAVKTFYVRLLSPQNIIVSPTARVATQIAILTQTGSDISVSGVGGLENTLLTYEVRDSLGIPINRENKVAVQFQLEFAPNPYAGGGTAPSLLPSVDSTDDQGKVRVSVLSGTQAGVAQLIAKIDLTNPVRTIVSKPVRISVNSGFVDQKHFMLSPSRRNFPGLERAFITMDITALAGDKYSNPAQSGTDIYFNSANGVITTKNTQTNDLGFASNTLISGPLPPLSPNLASGLTDGFSRVYATTKGENSTVSDSVLILWTGSPIITKTSGSDTFTLQNGETTGPYKFTVMDYLGHPLSEGTTIDVSGVGLAIDGNGSTIMPDTQVGGDGLTSFTITISDADPGASPASGPKPSILMVTVKHPVYGTYTKILATGTVN